MSPHIAIVDYKMGNLRSVQKSFEHAGVEDVVVTDNPALIEAADGIGESVVFAAQQPLPLSCVCSTRVLDFQNTFLFAA